MPHLRGRRRRGHRHNDHNHVYRPTISIKTERRIMTVSPKSRITLESIVFNGGNIEIKGNGRSGRALKRRGLVTIKKDRYYITAKGRKWSEKNGPSETYLPKPCASGAWG